MIVGYPFYSPDLNKFVTYKVGQGIGAYSSWASIAVLHHYLVRLAAYKALGVYNFRDYIVLGDDVVIFHSLVAGEYKEIIQGVGVAISVTKTISPRTSFFGTEFASKLTLNGIDISPLPLGLLLQKDTPNLLKFWCTILERRFEHGGAALTEDLLRCIPRWLGGVSFIKDSDFKAEKVCED